MGETEAAGVYLQLLQFSRVALALGHHVPHLILVFLLLLQPFRLLPLLLLLGELQQREGGIPGAVRGTSLCTALVPHTTLL